MFGTRFSFPVIDPLMISSLEVGSVRIFLLVCLGEKTVLMVGCLKYSSHLALPREVSLERVWTNVQLGKSVPCLRG